MYKKLIFLAVLLPIMAPLPACNQGSTSKKKVVRQASKQDIHTNVNGIVTDPQGNPIEGAEVTLLGSKVYETTTDEDGHYSINDVFIAKSSVIIGDGDAGGQAGSTNSALVNNIAVNYEIRYEKYTEDNEGNQALAYAIGRDTLQVVAQAYRSGNGYAIETRPVRQDVQLNPFASFDVEVLTGEYDGSGNLVAASDAQVWLMPPASQNAGTNQFGVTDSFAGAVEKTTDSDGLASYTAEDQLPAQSGYRLVVMPYDEDPSASDGYEYGTVVETVDLSSLGNAGGDQDLTPTYEVDLREGNNSNDVLDVAFNSLNETQVLTEGEPITLIFTRPVDTRNSSITIEDATGDSVPVEVSWDSANLVATVTVTGSLSNTGEDYDLDWNVTGIDGRTDIGTLAFGYDAGSSAIGTVATPELNVAFDLNNTGVYRDSYAYAVDMGSVFAFDGDASAMDSDSFLGTTFNQETAIEPDGTTAAAVDTDVELRWEPVADAAGYNVYWRSEQTSPHWTQVNSNLVDNQTSDGTYIHYTASGVGIDAVSGDGLIDSAFAKGNQIQIAVLPVSEDGAETPLDPNELLTLSDNWGATVLTNLQTNFRGDSTSNAFNTTLNYDENFTVAFSEYMQGNTLTIGPGSGEYGVAAGGRVNIAELAWDSADANQSTMSIDLEPGITTQVTSVGGSTDASGAATLGAGGDIIYVDSINNIYVGDTVWIEISAGTYSPYTVRLVGQTGGGDAFIGLDMAVGEEDGQRVVLMGPVDVASPAVGSTINTYTDGAPDSLVVTEGLGFGSELTDESSNTDTLQEVRANGDIELANGNLTNGETVSVTNNTFRPEDTLTFQLDDTSGNAMYSGGDVLHGDNTVD